MLCKVLSPEQRCVHLSPLDRQELCLRELWMEGMVFPELSAPEGMV